MLFEQDSLRFIEKLLWQFLRLIPANSKFFGQGFQIIVVKTWSLKYFLKGKHIIAAAC